MLPRVGFSGLRAGLWTLRPQTTIIRTRAKNIHSLPQLLWGVSVCASVLIPMRGQESDPCCSSCFLPAFVPTHQTAALVMGRPNSEVPQYNDTAGKHSTKRRKCRANPYSTRPLSTEDASWELRLDPQLWPQLLRCDSALFRNSSSANLAPSLFCLCIRSLLEIKTML